MAAAAPGDRRAVEREAHLAGGRVVGGDLPRIVGSPRALPGHTFTSLWVARSRALDGIDSITPPACSGTTRLFGLTISPAA